MKIQRINKYYDFAVAKKLCKGTALRQKQEHYIVSAKTHIIWKSILVGPMVRLFWAKGEMRGIGVKSQSWRKVYKQSVFKNRFLNTPKN